MSDGVRLQKVIAEAGIASRRKAEGLITAGRVRVNGVVVRELGTRVDPDRDRIAVDGEPLVVGPRVYLLLNKPDGVVCSAEGPVDERGRPTVLSLVPGHRRGVHPVGRLDFHSRGALILTNDGELTQLLTHPRNGILKTYHAKFQGRLEVEELAALRDGVVLDDGERTRPAEEILVIKQTRTNTWVQIGLRQGLNRQIRRMGEAIGHPVLKLIRVAIGDLDIEGLEEGAVRVLRESEVASLGAQTAPLRARSAGRRRLARRGTAG
jgi:23S rRNA pseudouridine2605 synthase